MITHDIYTTYAPDTDITFIMKDTYEGEDVVATEVVGFYYGEPNETDTKEFIGSLKAEF